MSEEIIFGRNPVYEALKAGRPINKIMVGKGSRHSALADIFFLAKQHGIVVQEVDSAKLDALAQGVKHQGVAAWASPKAYESVDNILARAALRGEPPLLVLLDEWEDPHNFGAILRTADCAGAHGVLIPKRRGVSLSAAVGRTSAGAMEYVPVARIGNIAQTLETLKKQGLWVVGADMDAARPYYAVDLKGPLVVVIGGEGRGLSRLTRETCDILVHIPMRGHVNSLNAAVAGSLLLYEILRQREQIRQ